MSTRTSKLWLRRHLVPIVSLLAVLVGAAIVAVNLAGHAEASPGFSVTLLAQGGAVFYEPLDATPDPTGATIYFVARAANGQPGVFRVAATGGPVQTLLVGAPLVGPRGVVFSSDGQTLYVADPEAASGGAVFAVPSGGGSAMVVPGTQGTGARALDLVHTPQGDVLYIAGAEQRPPRATVLRLPLIGGATPTSILRGSPLAVADGVAVASNGKVYVAGRNGNGDGSQVVLEVDQRGHRPLVRSVRLGSPAGLALTADESALLVSSLAADGTSQVLIVDLTTGSTSVFNDVIGANRGSGGLHRAHQANFFAWCGIGRPGAVYGVAP
ncbi:MAG: hypothetical protein KIT87_20090 [Anaerolineae bacterium]|nr:hypothetical protein [Anaerolineae bacterium]